MQHRWGAKIKPNDEEECAVGMGHIANECTAILLSRRSAHDETCATLPNNHTAVASIN